MTAQSLESFESLDRSALKAGDSPSERASHKLLTETSLTTGSALELAGKGEAQKTVDLQFGGLDLFDGKLDSGLEQTSSLHDSLRNIRGLIDKDTVQAIRKNEQNDDGRSWKERQSNNSWLERRIDRNGLAWDRLSVGPAQLQRRQIDELRKEYPHLKDVDHQTEKGADKFVSAYLDREAKRFNQGAYKDAEGRDNPRHDEDPRIRQFFKNMQKHWDKARKEGDTEKMRKILIQSYNIGGGRNYLARVEGQRTGKPVAKKDMPILTEKPNA